MKRLLTLCLALSATVAAWADFTPAAFTVSAEGKQVWFSQGNLQCTLSATDTTWAFAVNQYDMIGADNVSGSALASKIDLFGWSANNTTAPWGISTSTNSADYSGDFVDWGKNIGDGNTWRTLTSDEWDYLLNTRANASDKKSVARINLNDDGSRYANGLILLPDSWTCPSGVTFTNGFSSDYSVQAYADYQTFTFADWQKLEAAGALFLPAVGNRYGTNVRFVQEDGEYWSAMSDLTRAAYCLYFFSNEASTGNYDRSYGQAVRLVQDVYAVNIVTATNGKIDADKTAVAAGATVMLTVTPETGYEVENITIKDADNKDVTLSADYTFTMPAGDVTVTATFKTQTNFVPHTADATGVYAENGRIHGPEGMRIFTITGQDVTNLNGSLSGVYVVKIGGAATKIVVR